MSGTDAESDWIGGRRPSRASITNHPFTKPSADVMFITSDDVEFRLHKQILSEASPFFESMFSLPQPCPEQGVPVVAERDGLPVVHVSEQSAIIDNLMRLCYPIKDPDSTDLGVLSDILGAARKYEMEEATQLMIAAIQAQTSQSPLRTFAIAYIHDLEDIASKAAEEVERQQLWLTYVDELETIPAKAYIRLLDFCMVKKTPRPYTFCHGSNISQQQSSVQTPLPDVRATSNASPPFDDLPGADMIIRTSDMVEFRVHRVILNMGAPGLLRISPTPYDQHSPDSSDNGIASSNALPLLQLTEKSETISTLLRMCYPCDSPILLSKFDALYTAAKRYSMQMVMKRLRHELINLLKGCDGSEPYYLLACRHGFKDVVYESAKAFSERDLAVWIVEERSPKSILRQSFDTVPASAVLRLLQFHREVKSEVLALTSNWVPKLEWHGLGFIRTINTDGVVNTCQLPTCRPGRSLCWLPLFMDKVRPMLEKEPRGLTIRDRLTDILLELYGKLLDAHSTRICAACRKSTLATTMHLKQIVCEFVDKVDEVANKVPFESLR